MISENSVFLGHSIFLVERGISADSFLFAFSSDAGVRKDGETFDMQQFLSNIQQNGSENETDKRLPQQLIKRVFSDKDGSDAIEVPEKRNVIVNIGRRRILLHGRYADNQKNEEDREEIRLSGDNPPIEY